MEAKHKKIITRQLPELIKVTNCNEVFLATFRSKNILTNEDVEIIKAKEISTAQATTLNDILIQRRGSFGILLTTLLETSQTGAAYLLVKEKESDWNVRKIPDSNSIVYFSPDYTEELVITIGNDKDEYPNGKKRTGFHNNSSKNTKTSNNRRKSGTKGLGSKIIICVQIVIGILPVGGLVILVCKVPTIPTWGILVITALGIICVTVICVVGMYFNDASQS